jgi:hypothetical protein
MIGTMSRVARQWHSGSTPSLVSRSPPRRFESRPLIVPTDAANRAWRHFAKQQRVSMIAAADVLAGNSDLA